jgi:hypothetical protein
MRSSSILWIAVLASLVLPARAIESAQEFALKAAYLYNFAKFIDWPKPFTGNFNLCLLGRDSFAGSLDNLESKSVKGQPIRVLREVAGAGQRQCQILYLGEHVGTARELAQLAEQGVLTIAENENFIDSGGLIGLALDNDRLVFDINLEAARRANFNISARLLRLARRVR